MVEFVITEEIEDGEFGRVFNEDAIKEVLIKYNNENDKLDEEEFEETFEMYMNEIGECGTDPYEGSTEEDMIEDWKVYLEEF